MSPEVKEKIDGLIASNKILVFMKGTKLMPQCGFSNNVAQILNSLGAPYETVDVLADFDVRQGIKEYSNWPTIPQVYIDGEFIGGSDIMIELYQSGKLQEMVEVALAS
ncbi:MAG: Grx4 family monothiol glutaredoxin [Cyanobacteria bacterium P01_D01_bin.56]